MILWFHFKQMHLNLRTIQIIWFAERNVCRGLDLPGLALKCTALCWVHCALDFSSLCTLNSTQCLVYCSLSHCELCWVHSAPLLFVTAQLRITHYTAYTLFKVNNAHHTPPSKCISHSAQCTHTPKRTPPAPPRSLLHLLLLLPLLHLLPVQILRPGDPTVPAPSCYCCHSR